MNIEAIFITMSKMFTLILLGYGLMKKGSLDKNSNRRLSGLVVSVLSPALILSSVCSRQGNSDKNLIWSALLIGIILYVVLIIISKIIIALFHLETKERSVFELLIIFNNTAFIGYPILRVMYGEFSVFVFSVLHMPFNILIYSYGVFLIQKGKKDNYKKIDFHNFISTGIISSLLAIIIYFAELHIPTPFVELLSMVGEATIPLSMIVIGSSLALIPFKKIFMKKKIYVLSLIKLVGMPIFAYVVVGLLPIENFLKELVIVTSTLPAGSMIVMLSAEYEGNTEVASIGVFVTTLFSVVTIPIMIKYLIYN
ncbi:MAG: AEC family transporter [Longicatena sp.]